MKILTLFLIAFISFVVLPCHSYSAKDTLPPIPLFKFCPCCGGTHIGLPYIVDMPRNSDRSNLGTIIFDSIKSFNYRFSYDDFIPGVDSITRCEALVIDRNKDARIFVTVTDYAGNDTTIQNDYYSLKLAVRPNLDFGLLPIGESKDMDCWIINEQSKADAILCDLFFKDGVQGFSMSGINLPYLLKSRDSVKIKVHFLATQNGVFKDSIGVKDTCWRTYFESQLKAHVDWPRIDVSDWNFGDVPVGTTGNGTITIRNIGTTDLIITGYTNPTLMGNGIYLAPDLQAISVANPLTLAPNQTFTFDVLFIPPDTLTYLDSMLFISNTEKTNNPDSVDVLSGRGSPVSFIEYKNTEGMIEPYPNPADEEFIVNFRGMAPHPVYVRLFDSYGNVVYLNKNVEGDNLKIRTNEFPSGMYFLQIRMGSELINKKIIIMH